MPSFAGLCALLTHSSSSPEQHRAVTPGFPLSNEPEVPVTHATTIPRGAVDSRHTANATDVHPQWPGAPLAALDHAARLPAIHHRSGGRPNHLALCAIWDAPLSPLATGETGT
jgi:hypothetical protein